MADPTAADDWGGTWHQNPNAGLVMPNAYADDWGTGILHNQNPNTGDA